MTKNPNQMQIDYGDFNDLRIETHQAADELDELLFSPSFHSLDPETLKIGLDCAGGVKPAEVVETSASVRLKDRANNLHRSLKEYSRASSNLGFIDKITDSSRVRASEIDWNHVDRLGGSARRHDRLGKEALAIAFGSIDELVAAGFSRAEVKQKLSEETSKFEDYYYNPKNNTDEEPEKNDNRRKALRKATKKYLDLPN